MITNGLYTSNTNEWWTPPFLLDCVKSAMGDIDLDPCAPTENPEHTGATRWFTADHDGLASPWHGRVFMNPPYGTEIPKWVGKAITEIDAGRASVVIACVASRPQTRWFQRLLDYPVVFLSQGVKFLENGATVNKSAPFGTALVSIRKEHSTEQLAAFVAAFSSYGKIVTKVSP